MFRNNGVRRFCGNIYGCPEAALFLGAKGLASYIDQCGTCNTRSTYIDFMQHGLIVSCRMCTLLSKTQGSQPQDTLSDCFQKHGRHCPLCAFEYTSLSGRDPNWLKQASEVVRCFIGGAPKQELARRLYIIAQTELNCTGLRSYIQEIIEMLDEATRDEIKRRTREADRLTKLGILPP
jgi:hypothetical protein